VVENDDAAEDTVALHVTVVAENEFMLRPSCSDDESAELRHRDDAAHRGRLDIAFRRRTAPERRVRGPGIVCSTSRWWPRPHEFLAMTVSGRATSVPRLGSTPARGGKSPRRSSLPRSRRARAAVILTDGPGSRDARARLGVDGARVDDSRVGLDDSATGLRDRRSDLDDRGIGRVDRRSRHHDRRWCHG
jgi:hypothetical protein